jgi:hypothetical protein
VAAAASASVRPATRLETTRRVVALISCVSM